MSGILKKRILPLFLTGILTLSFAACGNTDSASGTQDVSSDVPKTSEQDLDWDGFLCWTQLQEEMIVVSAQLTDWHDTSARQAIELTEYFLANFSVDASRVYAAGYSAGGETMSQAVSMRPDLYAAYLHGASQWDGEYAPIAENGTAVYIFMAEHDEYMAPSGHGVLTTVSIMPMRKLDGARSKSVMFFKSRRQMTNGSLSGVLPAIIMAAAMWFLGKMMF